MKDILALYALIFLICITWINAQAQQSNIAGCSSPPHSITSSKCGPGPRHVGRWAKLEPGHPSAAGDVLGALNGRMPAASGQANLRPDAYGFLWIDRKVFLESFAQDVDPVQARIMATVQKPFNASIFGDKVGQAAWRSKPSWYLVSENDRMVNPDLERFMANRIGAKKVVSIAPSHASLVSHPRDVVQLVTDVANATAVR